MRGKSINIGKEVFIDLYINQNKPMHEIAKILNISIAKVYNDIKGYQIPTRDKKTVFTFKGHKVSDEGKLRIGNLNKGKKLSEETKEKMSEAKYGKRINNEWNGHKKKRFDGYVGVYKPEHPNSNKDGYVMEHHLVMEKYLGRYLEKNEIVHHINKVRSDNRIQNLMIFSSQADHTRYHNNLRRYEKECS